MNQRVLWAHCVYTSTEPYITFFIWGGKLLLALQYVLHSRGVWEDASPSNFRCSEVHSGTFWSIQRNTQIFMRGRSSSWSSSLAGLMGTPSARAYTECMHNACTHSGLVVQYYKRFETHCLYGQHLAVSLDPINTQRRSLSGLHMGTHTGSDPRHWGWWVWLARLVNSNTAISKHAQ